MKNPLTFEKQIWFEWYSALVRILTFASSPRREIRGQTASMTPCKSLWWAPQRAWCVSHQALVSSIHLSHRVLSYHSYMPKLSYVVLSCLISGPMYHSISVMSIPIYIWYYLSDTIWYYLSDTILLYVVSLVEIEKL